MEDYYLRVDFLAMLIYTQQTIYQVSRMSNIKQLPPFDDMASVFSAAGIHTHPSYAHGVWLGMISGGVNCSPKAWVDVVIGKPDSWNHLSTPVQHMLLALAESSVEQLGDSHYVLQILLPDDDEELEERLLSLGEFCEGFSQAFTNYSAEHGDLLDADAAEALSDIRQVKELSLELSHGPEDEADFMEVLEYVRVGICLIHQSLLLNRTATGKPPPFLH